MFGTSSLGNPEMFGDNHPIYPLVDNDLIGTGFFGGFDAEFLDQLRPQRAPWWLALAVLLALASFLAIGPFVGEVFTTLAANLMKMCSFGNLTCILKILPWKNDLFSKMMVIFSLW